MGIKGLLSFLKPISIKVDVLERYKQRRIGIDMLCLLHRGAMADPTLMMTDSDPSYNAVKRFVSKNIKRLTNTGIQVICIFDGDQLPAKRAEAHQRRELREDARQKVEQLIKDGASKAEVYGTACKGVSISGKCVNALVQLCIHERWPYIISPYEADPQLAYLCRSGVVDAILSEDSDLLAYGCPRLLTKWRDTEAIEIDLSSTFNTSVIDLGTKGVENSIAMGTVSQQLNSVISGTFTYQRFVWLCLLTSCDYIEGKYHIPGFGISTVIKNLFKHKTLNAVLKYIEKEKKIQDKFEGLGVKWEDVEKLHKEAEKTFFNHVVYCPIKNAVITINDANIPLSPKSKDGCGDLGRLMNKQVLEWDNGFKGCLIDDIENYDASILGYCLNRTNTEWKKKIFGNSLVVSQNSPPFRELKTVPILSGGSKSETSQTSHNYRSLKPNFNTENLIAWNPIGISSNEGIGIKLKRRSLFKKKGTVLAKPY